jgi:hypothetical protein
MRRYLCVGHREVQDKLLEELPCWPMELTALEFENCSGQKFYGSQPEKQAAPRRIES